jgi:hypothetical protein
MSQGFTKGVPIDTDATLSANSNLLVPSQYAVKTYITNQIAAGGGSSVPTTRTISTTAPLSGGGDLTADRTLSITDAAADGTTKGAATFTAADFNSTSGLISIDYTNGQSASASNKGFLTSADWSTFNGKQISPWVYRLSGRWYTPSNNALAIGSTLNVANSIRFSPVIIERDITITQLGIAVVGAATAGSTCRVGIYTNNASTNQPLSLLVDSNTIALDGTAGQRIVSGLSVSLTRGLYWFAYFSNANTSGTIASIANLNLPDVLGTTGTLQNGLITGYSQSLTYTSLPATASGFSNLASGASSYCIFYYY